MEYIKEYAYEPVNFIAGTFEIAKEALPVDDGVVISERQPVKLVSGKAVPVTAADISGTTVTGLYGIAASKADGGTVPVYLTGEFFTSGLVVPSDVKAEELKPAFRNIGIFLK